MKSDTEICTLLADADPVVAADALDTSALTLRIETALGHGLARAVAEPTREETTMVTHREPDIEIPTTPSPRQPSRRGPLLAAAVAVAVILVGVGIAYAAGAFDSGPDVAEERLAVATELVDTWSKGWENLDPELVASVFAEDGVYIDEDLAIPPENMEFYMWNTARVTGVGPVGDLSPSGDNTYTWVQEFDSGGRRYRGDMEIELAGDLAARIEWLGDGYQDVGPASDS